MAEDAERIERIVPVSIEDEMQKSYIDYAMSVIVGRALPDARDGLKPVHRRILYAMYDMGIRSRSAYKKCARIVGEVLGKYHPHGDMAVYDALVRMAQDFNLRYPLIDGQGNFGSVDGDSAAAMRYTEARLAQIAEEMLVDIDKDTVDFVPNFDESLNEPEVLPAKLPNLLINGSTGIAVGMATNVPPHNLSEVIDATIMEIDDPEVEISEMMEVIQGPDFPTGGIIHGKWGIVSAFNTGRGSVKIRARTEMEETKSGKNRIIVTELPYQVNKARLIENIADLVKDKRIEGIADLRDESDRQGMRVVIELKKTAVPEIVENQLYKHTQMESTFGIINLALVNGEPKVLNLKETIQEYIKHRQAVVRRRTQFELDKAEKRAHILEGLLIALDNIDAVIKLIRGSKTVDDARTGLMENFELSQEQAQAILDMRLQKLTGLEREKIDEEYADLKEKITWYREVLASEAKILAIIKEELLEIKEKYGDPRRTEITEAEADLDIEDLIAEEDVVVIATKGGYIKRLPLDVYRSQGRGGRGIIGMETKEGDVVKDIFIASTHDYMLFFTNRGRVHWLKVYRIPESGRYSRGKAIVNLLEVEEGEWVSATFAIKEFTEGWYLMMATRMGKVKKTDLSAYSRPRRGGIIAIGLQEGDELIKVVMTDGKKDILLATRDGKALQFNEKKDVRPMGRPAMGVRGIRLRKGDRLVDMVIADEDETLLTVTENGFGKRTPFSDYPIQKRGGQGVINIKTTKRNGKVVGIESVAKDDEIMFTSAQGIVIRVPVKGISEIGRNTQGVTLMRLQEEDSLVGIASIKAEEDISD